MNFFWPGWFKLHVPDTYTVYYVAELLGLYILSKIRTVGTPEKCLKF